MERATAALGRNRKLALLGLPLVILPFLTLGFWALGGGRHKDGVSAQESPGLNVKLPAPRERREQEGKLSFYEVAQAEAQKRKPFSFEDSAYSIPLGQGADFSSEGPGGQGGGTPAPSAQSSPEAAEAKVYRGLTELNRQLAASTTTRSPETLPARRRTPQDLDDGATERLESFAARLHRPSEKDPQLESLNTMMEKILDIQHPERVQERLRRQTLREGETVLAVRSLPAPASISCLDTTALAARGEEGFYSLQPPGAKEEEGGTLPCMVHTGGAVVEGTVIRLRLLSDAYVRGVRIPEGHFVYGTVSLGRERMQVRVTSIRYGDALLPVRLEVYDLDGLPGIALPGALGQESLKGSAGSAAQTIGIASVDPTLKGQLTGAGISVLRTLAGKKVRQQRVYLRAGYRVLLHDTSKG